MEWTVSMRVLVTGAAGFIGSHLCGHLLEAGHEVIGIDGFDPYYARARKEANLRAVPVSARWRFLEADVAASALEGPLEGADVVYHLAARPGVRASWGEAFAQTATENIVKTQRLLEAAAKARAATFVFVSSSSVYGDASAGPRREDGPLAPGSPYGVSKVAGEHLTHLYGRERGPRSVVVRPFSVYGPRERPDKGLQRFLCAARDGTAVTVHGDGEQRRDFTYVEDVVAGIARAGEHAPSGTTLNLCSGHPLSVLEVLAVVRTVTGRTVIVTHGPEAPGDVAVTWGDTQRSEQCLGPLPHTPFEEGVARQWRAVLREGAA
jgi:nucleoside-diphosphate-sugar epimerase